MRPSSPRPLGFTAAKRKLLQALAEGDYQHEARARIDVKNALAMGTVSAEQVAGIVRRATGAEHSSSPHHGDALITVHLLKTSGWYIKFYFLDPSTVFISVRPVSHP